MRKPATVIGLTLLSLVVIDVVVAGALGVAERTGKLTSLVRYFEYGRSVPGKFAVWEADPNLPGNLYDVAWPDDLVARSAAALADEDPGDGPVIRSYGMSFVNNIIEKAVVIDPDLAWDRHAGPAAPPNFTYALFEDDRENRRVGDVVVLGILSSSVPAMAAMSNSTWSFEQPAPFTYPIYRPTDEGLMRIDPLVASESAHRALARDANTRRAWHQQLAKEDGFFAPQTYGLPWTDLSPFARLVRRSVAVTHVQKTEARIVRTSAYPYAEVLRSMVREFAETAEVDGQRPVVFLIQSRNPRDADLLALLKPVLDAEAIPYLATAEIADPSDPAAFKPDGHYKGSIDRSFAQRFIELLE